MVGLASDSLRGTRMPGFETPMWPGKLIKIYKIGAQAARTVVDRQRDVATVEPIVLATEHAYVRWDASVPPLWSPARCQSRLPDRALHLPIHFSVRPVVSALTRVTG
jgi:hypothetical protein